MRYKSIELCNYIGIYNGMGLTQINIDFTKCVTNKVIIRGKNGSGKSTLLNAISPNPDTNDNFIPNAEARKTVVLSNNGIDYVIKYIHPITNSGRGTTKGYISKTINGTLVELNPNGNISSCRDILFEEFNLDSNYLSLSKLTSENKGLVDSKPAERKKLVNSIIHNLETYNAIYKNLTKKASTFKSLINSLTYKIDYLGNEVQLNAKLGNIESRLKKLEEEKNQTIEAIAAVKVRISDYINILRDNNYDQIVSDLKDVNGTVKILKNSVYGQMNKYGINGVEYVKPFLDSLEQQLISLNNKLDSLKSKIPVLLSEREYDVKELQSKQAKLNSLQSDYDFTELKRMIAELSNTIAEHEAVFKQMRLSNINIISRAEFDSAMESLKYLKDMAYNILSSYSIEDINEVINNTNAVVDKIRLIPSMKDELSRLRSEEIALNERYNIFRAKREIASELVNRPLGCTIDSCPYIESAIKANTQYPEDEMRKLEEAISQYNADICGIDSTIDKYTLYGDILSCIKNIERELNSKIAFINKLPVRKDFAQTFLYRITQMDSFDDIDELYKFVDCGNMIEEYKIAIDHLHTYQIEYKIYETQGEIIDSIIDDINKISGKIDSVSSEIESTNMDIDETSKSIISLETTISKVRDLYLKINDSLIPSEQKQAELSKVKTTLENNTSELNTLEDNLAKLNTNMNAVENDINTLNEERNKIKHSLILLADYKVELAEYNDKYTKIEKIRYYSSSSTGIQTLYMQLYMNKIISTANELLSLLFDGEFVLQPFVINEQEFRIPCLGSGLMHDDISSMSTAQKSMISMILSYAILHQSATKYNIISLDEMDESLDAFNRSYFLTLIDRIMAILQCEQCFMISHNSELTTEMADLIILKDGANTVYGGNIIWKF